MSNHSNGIVVKDAATSHWSNRSNMAYYKWVMETIVSHQESYSLKNIIDVGCGDAQLLRHLKVYFEETWAVDIEQIPSCADQNVQADFLTWNFTRKFDCVMCLQVLEHLPDPKAFVRKLFDSVSPGGSVIITVPYLWAVGAEPQHPQDPVDLFKFVSWLPPGIVPDEMFIVSEKDNPFRRLLSVFHHNLEPAARDPEVTYKLHQLNQKK